jgi:hypothetical protein
MKEQTVTFKVDSRMYEQLKNIPNKSEFIRNSLFQALNNICPLCNGEGVLNSCQQEHWDKFIAEHHHLEKCSTCNTVHLACTDK